MAKSAEELRVEHAEQTAKKARAQEQARREAAKKAQQEADKRAAAGRTGVYSA